MDCEKLDQVSKSRSNGSKRCVSSQTRKISRGILVDSCAKFRPKTAEEGAVVPTEECQIPLHVEEDGKRTESVKDGYIINQSQSVHQDMPLLGTRALNRKVSTSEGHGMSGADEVHPTFSANRIHLKPGVDRNAKPQCQPVWVISGSKDANTEVIDKPSFTPEQPIIIEDDAEKEEIRGTETLRVSLWKILEKASPHEQHPSDCNLRNEPKGSDSVRKSQEEVVPESIPRSDTIECDSDHPNHSLVRKSTLPLGRKRSSCKLKSNRKTEPPLSNYKNKRQKKVCISKEGCNVGLSIGNTSNSPILKQKKGEKKGERQGSLSGAHNMFFHKQENQVENPRVDGWRQSFRNTNEDDKGFFCVKNSEFVKLKKSGVGKGSPQSPLGNTSDHPRSFHDHPKLQEDVDCPKDFGRASFKITTAQNSDVESPKIKVQTPIKGLASCAPHYETDVESPNIKTQTPIKGLASCTPHYETDVESPNIKTKTTIKGLASCAPHYETDVESPNINMQTPIKCLDSCAPHYETKTTNKGLSSRSLFEHVPTVEHVGKENHSPLELSGLKGIKSFRSLVSRHKEHMPDSPTSIYRMHDARELQGTAGMFRKPVMVEESAKGKLEMMSQSSDSEASEEDEDVSAEETSMLHHGKKKCHPGRFRVSEFSFDIASGKGIPTRPLEQSDQMDDLARAVTLLSSALERVKSKMRSNATKRSAEILMSVADKIHLQLQNAESHIQVDVGKLTSFSKSKKKHVESRFEELQEELKVMHQSFKKEVNKHFQNFKSLVDGLDVHQSELKVTMEKQRGYHKKLLSQAEEAIETDLIDAQKRITAIQNSARGKMVELKNIATYCLKDGIII